LEALTTIGLMSDRVDRQ